MKLLTLRSPWIAALTALVVCLLFGALMRPWTSGMGERLAQDSLREPPAQLEGGDALSQQLSFFALGGLRSLVVEILRLDATVAWSKNDWTELEQRYEQMTTLQPKREQLWSAAAFEMSSNAAGYFSAQRDLDAHQRARRMREYTERGEQFLLDGLKSNPQSRHLYTKLGEHYSNLHRRPQFQKAADAYKQAVVYGAGSLQARQRFYALCRIRGRELEAWTLGRELFLSSEQNHVPSVSCLLFVLQHKISVPPEQRLSVDTLFGSRERAVKMLRLYRNNSLQLPINGVADFLRANPIH